MARALTARRVLIGLDAWASTQPRVVRVAEKARNHCNLVIADALTNQRDSNSRTNGELELCRCVAPTSRRFVDVGPSDGEWTKAFLEHARRDVTGVLFEPTPSSASALRERFRGDGRVAVVEAALSDVRSSAKIPFYEDVDAPSASSLVPMPGGRSHVLRHVRVTALADELADMGWDHVDMVKIDAAGHDFKILLGAVPLFERRGVDIVQFKYGHMWGDMQNTLAEALNLLEGLGYTVLLLNRDGLTPFDYPRWRETFERMTFVAVQGEATELVRELVVSP